MSPTTLLCLATRSLRTTTQSVRVRPCQPRVYQLQPFSTTIPSPYPRKGAEDKDSINRESTEYTRSGTDDATANDPEAFDPSTTSPKSERDEGTKDGKSNLDVSPANPEVSKQRDTTEGGAERSEGSKDQSGEKRSGHGSPKKGKEI